MSKINFNVKSARNFRSIMEKYYLAVGEIDNALCFRSDKVRNFKGLITTNRDIIEKATDPSIIVKRQAEIAEWEKSINDENAIIEKLREQSDSAIKNAYDLVTADLYKAYCSGNMYNALVTWFHGQGLDGSHGEDTIRSLIGMFGKRVLTGKTRFKNGGSMVGNITRATFNKLFLAALCETMSLSYRFTYTLPEKAKSAK